MNFKDIAEWKPPKFPKMSADDLKECAKELHRLKAELTEAHKGMF